MVMSETSGRNRSALALAVAAQIRAERAASGMTQDQVVVASGLPRSTYLRLESGKRVVDVSQLAAVAKAVGMAASTLLARAPQGSHQLCVTVVPRTVACPPLPSSRGGSPAG